MPDLNMKKSWHPLLQVNQERVWKSEMAEGERKKAAEQRAKELEEERQMMELQRMQALATGKPLVEKLDFMYATPASGSGLMNGSEQEQYLLGNKRVDEHLKRVYEDKEALAKEKSFIAVQEGANNARDIAAKIREDPRTAIKMQEKAAFEALQNSYQIKMLRKQRDEEKKMKEQHKAEKKMLKKQEKEAKRAGKDRHRHGSEDRHHSRRSESGRDHGNRHSSSRSRSPRRRDSDRRSRYDEPFKIAERGRDSGSHYEQRDSRNSRDGPIDRNSNRDSHSKYEGRDRRDDGRYSEHSPRRNRSRSPDRRYYPTERRRSPSPLREPERYQPTHRQDTDRPPTTSYDEKTYSRDRYSQRRELDTNIAPNQQQPKLSASDREARLARMTQNADDHLSAQSAAIAASEKRDRQEQAREAELRAKLGRSHGTAQFLVTEQKKALGMEGEGLGDRINRMGNRGLQRSERDV